MSEAREIVNRIIRNQKYEDGVADVRRAVESAYLQGRKDMREDRDEEWRERELARLQLIQTAFEEYDSGELSERRLRNVCCLLWSAPPTKECMDWAMAEAERLGLIDAPTNDATAIRAIGE